MKTSLYRFYSAKNELLYIGISRNPFLRLGQHQSAKEMPLVRYIELEWFADRCSADRAERLAILRESPIWNKSRPENPRNLTKTKMGDVVAVERVVSPHPWRHFALGVVDGVPHDLTFCVSQDGAHKAARALRKGDFLHLSENTPSLADGFVAGLQGRGVNIVWVDGPYIPAFGLSPIGHGIAIETAKLEAMLAGKTPAQQAEQIRAWSSPFGSNLPKPQKRKAK